MHYLTTCIAVKQYGAITSVFTYTINWQTSSNISGEIRKSSFNPENHSGPPEHAGYSGDDIQGKTCSTLYPEFAPGNSQTGSVLNSP